MWRIKKRLSKRGMSYIIRKEFYRRIWIWYFWSNKWRYNPLWRHTKNPRKFVYPKFSLKKSFHCHKVGRKGQSYCTPLPLSREWCFFMEDPTSVTESSISTIGLPDPVIDYVIKTTVSRNVAPQILGSLNFFQRSIINM